MLQVWWSYHKKWGSRWWLAVRPNTRENGIGAAAAIVGAAVGWNWGFISKEKILSAIIVGVAGYGIIFLLYSLKAALFTSSKIDHEQQEKINKNEIELADAVRGELEPKKRELEDASTRLASLNKKLRECEEKRQMPRPYLDVADSADSMFIRTSFVLTNRGGDVAHNVRILPLTINHKTVTFEMISALPINSEKSTIAFIDNSGVMQQHDILSLMVHEWDAAFSGGGLASLEVDEWPKELKITYEDFTGKKFEATLDLVVFPIQKTLADKHRSDWPNREYKVVEVRNIKFKPV
jgi:hypothetical protein